MVIGRLAHVALGGADQDAMLEFYAELLGVVEVSRNHDTVFLSGGTKPGYDLALGPWPAGLDHIAFEVTSEDDLAEVRESLESAGVEVREVELEREHEVADGIQFVFPSGHVFELILSTHRSVYPGTPAIPAQHFRGVGPVVLEHVSINCDDIAQTAAFLEQHLGFANTEYSQHADEPWFLAFLRCRDLHHDLGMFHDPEWIGPGFNHVGFCVPSFDRLVRAADIAFGLGHKLQCSPGRHLVGDNVFIYLVDPSGNRVEIATPLVRIDPSAPTKAFDAKGDEEWHGFDAWRTGIPPAARWPTTSRDGRVPVPDGTASTNPAPAPAPDGPSYATALEALASFTPAYWCSW